MAFIPANLGIIVQPIGGDGMRFASYRSDDGFGTITAADYFKGATGLGLRKYDLVFVSPIFLEIDPYIVVITSINGQGDGTAEVSDPVLPGSIGINELDASVVSVIQSALQPAAIGVSVQAFSTSLATLAGTTPAATGLSLLQDATASDALDTLGVSAYVKTLLDDADASAAQTTLGVSTYIKTLLDDANAGAAQTTLGISTFVKTLLDDADASAFLTTLGVPYATGTYTPTVTAQTGTITTLGSRFGTYVRIGNQVTVTVFAGITTNGSGAGSILISLPPGLTPASGLTDCIGAGRETGVNGVMLQARVQATVSTMNIYKYDNTYPGVNGAIIEATVTYFLA